MSKTFGSATAFNQPVGDWNTAKVSSLKFFRIMVQKLFQGGDLFGSKGVQPTKIKARIVIFSKNEEKD